MRAKDKLDTKINFSLIKKDKELDKKVKIAQDFNKKADKCKYHELKSINNLIYQKVYWCKKINNRCNLATCPLNKQ